MRWTWIFCLALYTWRRAGAFSPPHELLDISGIDHVLVIAPTRGQKSSLLNQLQSFIQQRIRQDIDVPDIQRSLKRADRSILTQAFIGPQIVVIHAGEVDAPESVDSEECYSMLYALKAVFGWRVFGLFGEADIAYLHISRVSLSDSGRRIPNMIRSMFRYSIIVSGETSQNSDYIGPNEGSTLFLSTASSFLKAAPEDTGPDPRTIWHLKQALIQSDVHLLHNPFLTLTRNLGVARVIVSSDTDGNLLGSRLMTIYDTHPLLLSLKPTVSITRFTALPTILWPISLPVLENECDFYTDDFDHIAVIPDIHGDLLALIQTLWMLYDRFALEPDKKSLQDFQISLSTGVPLPRSDKRIALVQLGDVVDRGPNTYECLHLLLGLEHMFGWKVVRLYGNHELMNFHRTAGPYVDKDDFLQNPARGMEFSIGGSLWTSISQISLMAARFSSKTSDGDGVLFVHAGIDLDWFDLREPLMKQSFPTVDPAQNPVYALNLLSRYTLTTATDLSYIWAEENSPIWTRAFERLDEHTLCDTFLPQILAKFKVSVIFVGHSPQKSRKVRARCDNRIMLTDTAMSRWMGFGSENPTSFVISFGDNADFSIDEMYIS